MFGTQWVLMEHASRCHTKRRFFPSRCAHGRSRLARRRGEGRRRRANDSGRGRAVPRDHGAGAHHFGEEAVGDDLVGGVGGVVRVPEHEVLAVGAELRGRQAEAPHRRVHVAARRVRRLEPCTPEAWTTAVTTHCCCCDRAGNAMESRACCLL